MIVLGWETSPAQSSIQSKIDTRKSDLGQLKMVVILSRHGVRSPTWTAERLNTYSAQPWPVWSVAPGILTTRGYELVKEFGSYDRTVLAQDGLLSSTGCADAAKTYVWADTDQRTIASGHALADGFFAGCELPVHSLASGVNDPLFHPAASGVQPEEAKAAFNEVAAMMAQKHDPQMDGLLTEMQNLLNGCGAKVACTPAHTPQVALLGAPIAVLAGKGDHIVDLQGPLPQASSFAEDFLLEYSDGMPMQQVGWGRVDEAEMRKLLGLHSDYFDLVHRSAGIARIEASNMLFHIERTLQQHVDGVAGTDALGTPDTKLVVLAGHDTNIAAVTALLGLHWELDGRKDDTPPGTELAFELWQDAAGAYEVRITVSMQTLDQLRGTIPLTMTMPPAQQTLKVEGWPEFRNGVEKAIDKNDVLPLQGK